MSVNYSQNAQEILISIGGKENVISTAHCATRLRLVLVCFSYRFGLCIGNGCS